MWWTGRLCGDAVAVAVAVVVTVVVLLFDGVQLGGDRFEVGVVRSGQVCAFWEVLAQETVGVLVGPALPRAVRIGEEHGDAGLDGDRGVGGEFLIAVRGQRSGELCRSADIDMASALLIVAAP